MQTCSRESIHCSQLLSTSAPTATLAFPVTFIGVPVIIHIRHNGNASEIFSHLL